MDDKRRQILEAALALADEEGLDAVSMRAVAARVGVSPMALYPYVGSKAALLDGMVGQLLGTLPRPDATDSRAGLQELAHALRALAKAHPAAFALLLSRPSVTPDAARAVDRVYQGLLDIGVPRSEVPRLERMFSSFVLGFAHSEVSGRFAVDDPQLRRRRGTDLPAHQAIGSYLTDVDWDAEFEADLRDLEAIIARWAAPG
jgi:AcrR family transcriptional regulator